MTPAQLKIKVIDPGQLIVSYADKNIAVITGGDACFIRDAFLIRSSSVWSIFKASNEDDTYSAFKDRRVDAVLNTLRAMRAIGHGGAIVIVPDDDGWKGSVDLPIRYSGEQPFRFVSVSVKGLNKAEEDDHALSPKVHLFRDSLERSATTLAQLTAVDGATLLSRNLDVVGFGVGLRAAPNGNIPDAIYRIDALDHSDSFKPITLEKLGGMRHQSAARFIFNQRNAIALVASQDGNVTAFVWKESEEDSASSGLYAYGQLELTLS